MSEMELMKRIEALEKRVAELESTIDTIKDIGKSERMAEFIDKKKRANSMINLIQQLSGESLADTTESEHSVSQMKNERENLEQSIRSAFDKFEMPFDNLKINENEFDFDEVDGGVEITGYKGFNYDCIIIPLYIKDQPVVGIGASAFNCSKCKRIYISDNVTYISKDAFRSCYLLTEVYIGNGVTFIYDWAFAECKRLKKIRIGIKVKTIGSYCFKSSGLRRVSLPNSVEMIGTACFENCEMLSGVELNNGLKSIGQNAFENTKIDSIVLPETIHSLGLWVFKNQFMGSEIRIAFLGTNKQDYISIGNFADKSQNKIIIFCESSNAIKNYAQRLGFEVRPLAEFQ